MNSQNCHRMNGSATNRPGSAPTFRYSMKISAGSVEMSVPPFGSIACSGPNHEVEDVGDEEEGNDAADHEGDDAQNQPLPELVEMLQKRHLAAGLEVVGVGELDRGRHRGPGWVRATCPGNVTSAMAR